MIEIDLFEQEIISLLRGNAETVSVHPEITKSKNKTAAMDVLKDLAEVGSYQGNIEEIMTENIIPLPAALTIYGGAQNDNTAAREGARGKINVSLNIFIVGENLMGRPDASKDVRRILTSVRTVLNGLIYKDRTLLWTAEELSIINKQGVCAYEQLYKYQDWIKS